MNNSRIPTESFFVANDRIMAAICGGQLTTDHHLGLSHFYAPAKDSPTLIQSTRIGFVVDGRLIGAYDHDDRTCVISRGYADEAHAVRIVWQEADLEVTDLYFIPPDQDVVIQRVTVRNKAARARDVKLVGLLYPQLGSPIPHMKGACKEARFEAAEGCLLIEDLKGNVLAFGFDRVADEHQVGEVCGATDVYYDLEDLTLSGNSRVAGVVALGAVGLQWKALQPGEERTVDVCLGRAATQAGALAEFARFKESRAAAWPACVAYWRGIEDRSRKFALADEFGPRMKDLIKRSILVTKAILRPDGTVMGGVTTYHTVGQVRNSCYILVALDELGLSREARGGYEHYANFKLGDNRFLSADENDHLGTIIHVFKEHLDLTGDLALIDQYRQAIFGFGDKLLGLADCRLGLVYSERAIHEFVAVSRGYESYVNTMSWRGLADAAALAQVLGAGAEASRFTEGADRLRQAIVTRLVDPGKGIFVKRIYQGRHDTTPAISMMTPALYGVIDPNDPVVTRTIQHLLDTIWDKRMGGLYRYPLHLQPWQEHYYGGPWVTYTSWLGRLYLLRGELEKAKALLQWVLDNTPADSNLIPEHFSVQHLGKRGFHRVYLEPSTPEVWATAEFLRFMVAYEKTRAGK